MKPDRAFRRELKTKRGGQRPPLTVSRKELLVGGSDEAFREFIHGLLAVAVRLEEIRSLFGEMIGLSGIQYTILISIRHLGRYHDVSVKRIAEHLNLSGAFVTIETGKLLRFGLIEKRSDKKDRRRVRLTVTSKGQTLLEALAPTQRRINDVLFESLTAGQFHEHRKLVPKLVNSASRALRLLNYYAGDGKLLGGARGKA